MICYVDMEHPSVLRGPRRRSEHAAYCAKIRRKLQDTSQPEAYIVGADDTGGWLLDLVYPDGYTTNQSAGRTLLVNFFRSVGTSVDEGNLAPDLAPVLLAAPALSGAYLPALQVMGIGARVARCRHIATQCEDRQLPSRQRWWIIQRARRAEQ